MMLGMGLTLSQATYMSGAAGARSRGTMANYEEVAGRLRRLARNPAVRFLYRRHAETELRADGIEKLDIENMLRRCSVSLSEISGRELTHRAEGTDGAGRPIAAVVVMYEEDLVIKVITGWAGKR
jgi:hypothetical protein